MIIRHRVKTRMQLICYPLMSTCSKRAITRIKKKWGHPVTYTPRATLVERLSRELGMTYDQVIDQLFKERDFLLKYRRYYG
jgi:hypothetical protein